MGPYILSCFDSVHNEPFFNITLPSVPNFPTRFSNKILYKFLISQLGTFISYQQPFVINVRQEITEYTHSNTHLAPLSVSLKLVQ
jgi:hypothetical protein